MYVSACVSVLSRTYALSTINRHLALNLAPYVREFLVCSRASCVLACLVREPVKCDAYVYTRSLSPYRKFPRDDICTCYSADNTKGHVYRGGRHMSALVT